MEAFKSDVDPNGPGYGKGGQGVCFGTFDFFYTVFELPILELFSIIYLLVEV